MNDIEYKIKVMEAFKDGKTIQNFRTTFNKWMDINTPVWNWHTTKYRIKPEPETQLLNQDDILNSSSQVWIEDDGVIKSVVAIDNYGVLVSFNINRTYSISWEDIKNMNIFINGKWQKGSNGGAE